MLDKVTPTFGARVSQNRRTTKTQPSAPPEPLLAFSFPSWILGVIVYDLGGDRSVPFVLCREIEGMGHLELDHGDETKVFTVQKAQAGLCMGKNQRTRG